MFVLPKVSVWGAGKVAVTLVIGVLAGGSMLLAQTNAAPQIWFLHLKIRDQAVTLLDTSTRPGVLKRQLELAPAGIRYELVSAAGTCLWKGTIPDPVVRHIEYEEPAGSGVLKRKSVAVNEAEFVVRIPVLPEAKRLNFYRLEPSVIADPEQKSPAHQLLGSVELP